jgi:carboxyl-terminal processing protease
VPDIVVPDKYEYLKFREKDNTNALPWDEIAQAQGYKKWEGGYDLQAIKNLSNARIANNPIFREIKKNTEWLSQQNDKEYSLQIDKFKKEQQSIRTTARQIDSLEKLKQPLNISFLPQDSARLSGDKDKADRYNQWLKSLKSDIYLDQAIKVVGDIQNQKNLAKGALQKEKEAKAF